MALLVIALVFFSLSATQPTGTQNYLSALFSGTGQQTHLVCRSGSILCFSCTCELKNMFRWQSGSLRCPAFQSAESRTSSLCQELNWCTTPVTIEFKCARVQIAAICTATYSTDPTLYFKIPSRTPNVLSPNVLS